MESDWVYCHFRQKKDSLNNFIISFNNFNDLLEEINSSLFENNLYTGFEWYGEGSFGIGGYYECLDQNMFISHILELINCYQRSGARFGRIVIANQVGDDDWEVLYPEKFEGELMLF